MLHSCPASSFTVPRCLDFSSFRHGPHSIDSFLSRDLDVSRKIRSPMETCLPTYGLKSNRISEFWKLRYAQARACVIEEVEEKDKGAKRGSLPFKCLSQLETAYNKIVILESSETTTSQFAGCRILLLDHSGNVHSIYKRDSAWTGACWDEFASLPAIIPAGPVGIFGLAGGTAARLLLELWPSLKVEGFEIDAILVDQARLHLGLADLEVPTREGGCLTVHIDDVFCPSATVDDGFAGIIVDIFSEGTVPVELLKEQTWLDMQKRLRPGGRILINCGGVGEKGDSNTNLEDGTRTGEDGRVCKNATLKALASAFQGQVNWREMDSEDSDNLLALTGPLPDFESWAAALPEKLKEGVFHWRSYN